MTNLICIACGGAVGAILRWRIHVWMEPYSTAFPLGTLCANLLGCFILGFLAEPVANWLAPSASLGLRVGMMGALTTFSTFSFETVRRFEAGESGIALLNVLASVCLCLAAVWCGLTVGRWFVPG